LLAVARQVIMGYSRRMRLPRLIGSRFRVQSSKVTAAGIPDIHHWVKRLYRNDEDRTKTESYELFGNFSTRNVELRTPQPRF